MEQLLKNYKKLKMIFTILTFKWKNEIINECDKEIIHIGAYRQDFVLGNK